MVSVWNSYRNGLSYTQLDHSTAMPTSLSPEGPHTGRSATATVRRRTSRRHRGPQTTLRSRGPRGSSPYKKSRRMSHYTPLEYYITVPMKKSCPFHEQTMNEEYFLFLAVYTAHPHRRKVYRFRISFFFFLASFFYLFSFLLLSSFFLH